MLSIFKAAFKAEWIGICGSRGIFTTVILPLAVGLPLLITTVVAVVSEYLAKASSLVGVLSTTTDNAAYWIIHLSVIVFASVATFSQAASYRGSYGDLCRHLLPQVGVTTAARWLMLSLLAVGSILIMLVVALAVLPVVSHHGYGEVDLLSPTAARLLWAVPLYACAAIALGLGLGALMERPAFAVACLLIWVLFIENAIAVLPSGVKIIRFMPFLNGIYGTGQRVGLEPPWGTNGALVYFVVLAAVFVALGWAKQRQVRW